MDRDIWALVLDYWGVTLFVPAILLILMLLSVVTRLWDGHQRRRDASRTREASNAEQPRRNHVLVRPSPHPRPQG
jgi:hypothetical protein